MPVIVKRDPPAVNAVLGLTPEMTGAVYENVSVLLTTEATVTAMRWLWPCPAGALKTICESAHEHPTHVVLHTTPSTVTDPLDPKSVPVIVRSVTALVSMTDGLTDESRGLLYENVEFVAVTPVGVTLRT